jgi:TonB family protein
MGKSLAAIVLCSIATVQIFAQEKSHGNVSVVKLFPPVYPPLAKQARIAGDVQLTLAVRPDGSINSATVVSGHPLLKQAALDSAQRSQFACEKCGDEELKWSTRSSLDQQSIARGRPTVRIPVRKRNPTRLLPKSLLSTNPLAPATLPPRKFAL